MKGCIFCKTNTVENLTKGYEAYKIIIEDMEKKCEVNRVRIMKLYANVRILEERCSRLECKDLYYKCQTLESRLEKLI